MNIQTEHLDNHVARLTVEIDQERLEKAKQATVRTLAKRVNIPGFRKGKAPYNIMVRYVGEPAILEETMETLGQEVYRETLDQSGLSPYGPGQLENFKLDPQPTFIYTVPLQPTVELGEYRGVRVDFTEPEVTDEMLNQQIKLLQEEEALIEESHRPAALGNRVTVDIHSFFVDGANEATDENAESSVETVDDAAAEVEDAHDEAEHDHDHDDDDDDEHDHDEHDDEDKHDDHHHHGDDDREPYIHQHDYAVRLVEGEDEPIGPGFAQAMVGANPGESREFEIVYPNDDSVNPNVAGRTVKFIVGVNKVETMNLPVVNDDFAARFTERFAAPTTEQPSAEAPEQQPLTLLQLRMRLRELLQEDAQRASLDAYADGVLSEMVKGATIAYPEEMVQDQLNDMMKSVEDRLRTQGLTMDLFQAVTGKTTEDLRADYRPQAVENLERSLVLGEVLDAEHIRVNDADLQEELLKIAAQFGDQAQAIMRSLNTPQMRSSVINRLLQEKAFERIAAIGRGTAPELEADEEAELTEVKSEEVAASEEG